MTLLGGASPRLEDAELRVRAQAMDAGVWLTYAACGALAVKLAFSWHGHNRPIMCALLLIAASAGKVTSKLPRERILRSSWREFFFLAWSTLDIVLIAVLSGLDGGARSPISFVFFLTVVFAALSYPLWLVAVVSVLNLGAFGLLGALTSWSTAGPDGGYLWMFSTCLAFTSIMCVWHARLHNNQHVDLARVSRTDPLTGALNRRGIELELDAEIERAGREDGGFVWLVLDLDHFKAVNDSYGHAAGDELLCWIVDATRGLLREHDAIGRLGGDEFAVLLSGAGRSIGESVARRLRETLAERTGVTTGLALFPVDGATRDDIQRHADLDLYAAKAARDLPERAERRAPASDAAVEALVAALGARDVYTCEHSRQVVELALDVACELGLGAEASRQVEQLAVLHDIGKLGISDTILQKAGPLDDDEWAAMRRHPEIGARIAASTPGLEELAALIRAEHENWDGSGYPNGLAGAEIPLASRIVFACDAYHAMTSDRPYRSALPDEVARGELELQAGRQFDPAVVSALTRALERPAVSQPA